MVNHSFSSALGSISAEEFEELHRLCQNQMRFLDTENGGEGGFSRRVQMSRKDPDGGGQQAEVLEGIKTSHQSQF